ncbi:MAG: precorrin-3B C(17)-methyltransferase [Pseudomonadota bacterium]
MPADPVLVALTPEGEGLGRRLAGALGAELHVRAPRGAVDAEVRQVAPHLRMLFAARRPILCIGAAGIVIRALAPLLSDKMSEPPVLAIAEDGSAVVPLLGGHRGANALAGQIGALLDTRPAVTTAGDLRFGVALDAPPEGWRLETPEAAKSAMAALLAGEGARVMGDAPWLAPLPAVRVEGPSGPVVVSVGAHPPLIYRRQDLVLGVGAVRGADPDAVIALAAQTLADAGLAEGEVAAIASIDVKADEAAVHALARHLSVPARFFDAATLEAETPRLTAPSEVVFAEVGCHGVAEGAALAAVGPGGHLVVEKRKSAVATVAVARLGEAPRQGRSRGHLAVVGIGPGDAEMRTPEASRLIASADEVVGYSLYLDLLGPLIAGKPRRDFPLGEEEDRCRYALERAGEGMRVALVSSGDAGIYAMGALVTELLARADGLSPAARRVEVVHVPGISALQAASARAGALLGHDFCAISLSDLLTPREDILRRLRAAADGDFVVALYNPVSRRRRTLLDRAREILLEARPAETPVLLASNLGRAEERLQRRTLGTLETDEVDMLTVVLIGSSQSRAVDSGDRSAGADGAWLYTPRGYARKGREGTTE